jgi:hypothetical protein
MNDNLVTAVLLLITAFFALTLIGSMIVFALLLLDYRRSGTAARRVRIVRCR